MKSKFKFLRSLSMLMVFILLAGTCFGLYPVNKAYAEGELPDLTVTAISLDPAAGSIYAGTAVSVVAAVYNNGSADISQNFRVLLKANNKNVAQKTIDAQTSPLTASAGREVAFSWTPALPGSYDLSVTADSGGAIAESDESNNILTVSSVVGGIMISSPNNSINTMDSYRYDEPITVESSLYDMAGNQLSPSDGIRYSYWKSISSMSITGSEILVNSNAGGSVSFTPNDLDYNLDAEVAAVYLNAQYTFQDGPTVSAGGPEDPNNSWVRRWVDLVSDVEVTPAEIPAGTGAVTVKVRTAPAGDGRTITASFCNNAGVKLKDGDNQSVSASGQLALKGDYCESAFTMNIPDNYKNVPGTYMAKFRNGKYATFTISESSSGDTTPPVFADGYPKVENITASTAELAVQTDEAGSAYYVVLGAAETAPTAAQVKSGQDSAGSSAAIAGSLSLTANIEARQTINDLSASTNYKVYVAAEDSASTPNITAVQAVDLTTTGTDTTPPVFATGYPRVENITGSTAELAVQTDEAGSAYYVVLGAAETAPTAAQVKSGQDSAGSSAAIAGSLSLTANTGARQTISGLSASTSYKVYVVAEDRASVPNITAVAVFSFETGSVASALWPQAGCDSRNSFQGSVSGPGGNVGTKWVYRDEIAHHCSPKYLVTLPDGTLYQSGRNDQGNPIGLLLNSSGDTVTSEVYRSLVSPVVQGGCFYGAIPSANAGKETLLGVDTGSGIVWESVYDYDIFENYSLRVDGSDVKSSALNADGSGLCFISRNDAGGYELKALQLDLVERWTFPLPESYACAGSPAIGSDGAIYLLAWQEGEQMSGSRERLRLNYRVYAIAADGTEKWEYDIPITGGGKGLTDIKGVALGPDGTLYVATFQQGGNNGYYYLSALEDNGTQAGLKWRNTYNSSQISKIRSMAVSADSTVYLAADLGQQGAGPILAVNGSDGSQKWAYSDKTFKPIANLVIDRDGVVYCGNYNGGQNSKIIALNPADGSQKWSCEGPVDLRTTDNALALGEGCLYAANGAGDTYGLDGSGRTVSMSLTSVDQPTKSGRYVAYGDTDITVQISAAENSVPVTAGIIWQYTLDDQNHIITENGTDRITFRFPFEGYQGAFAKMATVSAFYQGYDVSAPFDVLPNIVLFQNPQTNKSTVQPGEEIQASVLVKDDHGARVTSGISWFYTTGGPLNASEPKTFYSPLDKAFFYSVDDLSPAAGVEKTVINGDANQVNFTAPEQGSKIYLYAQYGDVCSPPAELDIVGGELALPSISNAWYDESTGRIFVEGDVAEKELLLKVILRKADSEPVVKEYSLGDTLHYKCGVSGLEPGDYTVAVAVKRTGDGNTYTEEVAFSQSITVPSGASQAKLIKDALDRTVAYYREQLAQREGKFNDWETLGLGWAGQDLQSAAWLVDNKGYAFWRASALNNNQWGYNSGSDYPTTDLERTILGILGAGYNPRDFNGMNIVSMLTATQNPGGNFSPTWGGSRSDNAQGNTQVFGIIALDSAGATIEEGYDAAKAVQCLLNMQGSNGSFSWTGYLGDAGSGDTDSTGMALVALGPHRNVPGVNEAIERAVNCLKGRQQDHGGFEGWGVVGYPNTESSAWVIQGLIACGRDPLSSEWEKPNGSLLTAFLGAQMPDGGFTHTMKPDALASNAMSTEQSLLALGDLHWDQSKYTNLWSPDLPSYNINQPLITAVKLSPTTVRQGQEKTVAVDVTTYLVEDGTVVNIDIIKDDGQVVSQIAPTSAVLQAGKAAAELIVPADTAAGTYKVRVACGELLSYGTLIVVSGSGGGSSPDNSISAYIRVEGYEDTVVPRTAVTTDNFDLTPYLGQASGSSATPSSGWGPDKLKRPTVAHALIKVLENEGIDCFDRTNGLDLQDYGWSLYVAMINGEREFDHRSTSGWMYRVNGSMPGWGCQAYNLKDGDDIVWYFGAYGFDTWYAEMSASKTSLKTGEETTLTLTGIKTDLSGSSGTGPSNTTKLSGAEIYVNGQPFQPGGAAIVTDENGQAKISFNNAGTYSISAERYSGEGYRNIVRPLPVLITVSGASIGESVPVPENPADAAALLGDTLNSPNPTAEQVAATLQAATASLAGALEKAKTADEAQQLLNHAAAVTGLLGKAGLNINGSQSAASFADSCVEIAGLLAALAPRISPADGQNTLAQAAVQTINATAQVMSGITDKNQLAQIANRLLDSGAAILGSLTGELNSELQQSLVSMVLQVLPGLVRETLPQDSLKSDGATLQAVISAAQTGNLAGQAVQTVAGFQQKLERMGIEQNRNLPRDIIFNIPSQGEKNVEISLPSGTLDSLAASGAGQMGVRTAAASFRFGPDSFGASARSQGVTLSAERLDENQISGGGLVPPGSIVMALQARVGGQNIDGFNSPVEVSIPYEGTPANPASVTVFLLKEDSSVEAVGGYYDPASKTVKFLAEHFSRYFAQEAVKSFEDLGSVPWAQEVIAVLAGKGIISGKGAGLFDPNAALSRAEFAALITRMLKYTATSGAALSFADVAPESWYYGAVAAAYQNGLISGRSPSQFDPEGNISREEMSAIIAKVLQSRGYRAASGTELNSFADRGRIASWAEQPAAMVIREGIITGMGDGRFAPAENATRAQAAVMLYRLYQAVMK